MNTDKVYNGFVVQNGKPVPISTLENTLGASIVKVEYAANDDATATNVGNALAHNRPDGSPFIRVNPTSRCSKELRWPTPFNAATDVLDIEISYDRINWTPMNDSTWLVTVNEALSRFQGVSTTSTGFGLYSGGTHIYYGRYPVGTRNWSEVPAGMFWRVVKRTYALVPLSTPQMKHDPHLWPVGQELDFGDGSFGRRFTGTITRVANQGHDIQLIASGVLNWRIMDSGGWFDTGNGGTNAFNSTIHSGGLTTIVRASGITIGTSGNLVFLSFSATARTNSPYDIWIRYTKV